VQHLYATTDISRVLTIIAEAQGSVARSIAVPEIILPEAPKSKPEIETVGKITDPMLESYITSRAIPLDLARLYLKQIAYRIGGRGYRALAFSNDSKGYEVRNPGFKGTLGKKDITFLDAGARTEVAVFEGVFDFLSMLAHYGQDKPSAHVLVLNSVALLERALARMSAQDIRKLYAYLDHDPAGESTLQILRERGIWEVKDGSGFYQAHKDANDFLMARQRGRDSQER
jgi:hypothetical protein